MKNINGEEVNKNKQLCLDFYNDNKSVVSTIWSWYSEKYETVIFDSHFSNDYIVVEIYKNIVLSKRGHKKWLDLLSNNKLVSVTNVSDGDVLLKLKK